MEAAMNVHMFGSHPDDFSGWDFVAETDEYVRFGNLVPKYVYDYDYDYGTYTYHIVPIEWMGDDGVIHTISQEYYSVTRDGTDTDRFGNKYMNPVYTIHVGSGSGTHVLRMRNAYYIAFGQNDSSAYTSYDETPAMYVVRNNGIRKVFAFSDESMTYGSNSLYDMYRCLGSGVEFARIDGLYQSSVPGLYSPKSVQLPNLYSIVADMSLFSSLFYLVGPDTEEFRAPMLASIYDSVNYDSTYGLLGLFWLARNMKVIDISSITAIIGEYYRGDFVSRLASGVHIYAGSLSFIHSEAFYDGGVASNSWSSREPLAGESTYSAGNSPFVNLHVLMTASQFRSLEGWSSGTGSTPWCAEKLKVYATDACFDNLGGMYDLQGRTVNAQGRLVDSQGRWVDENGNYVTEDGDWPAAWYAGKCLRIDSQGRHVDSDGVTLLDENDHVVSDCNRLSTSDGDFLVKSSASSDHYYFGEGLEGYYDGDIVDWIGNVKYPREATPDDYEFPYGWPSNDYATPYHYKKPVTADGEQRTAMFFYDIFGKRIGYDLVNKPDRRVQFVDGDGTENYLDTGVAVSANVRVVLEFKFRYADPGWVTSSSRHYTLNDSYYSTSLANGDYYSNYGYYSNRIIGTGAGYYGGNYSSQTRWGLYYHSGYTSYSSSSNYAAATVLDMWCTGTNHAKEYQTYGVDQEGTVPSVAGFVTREIGNGYIKDGNGTVLASCTPASPSSWSGNLVLNVGALILKSVKIYNGSTLVRDYVPWCSNEHGYLKDLVSGTVPKIRNLWYSPSSEYYNSDFYLKRGPDYVE